MQTLPTTTWDEYERVNAALGDEVPAGLIVHVAAPHEGGIRIIDVWESEQAHNAFRDERLMPAVAEVVGPERMAEGPGPTEVLEAKYVIRP
jgi:hypothetical protein